MNDLISMEQLVTELEIEIGETYNDDIIKGIRRAIEIVEQLPTVEPVRGGWIVHEWKEAKKGLVEPSLLLAKYECSRCHYLFENNSNFCPNCSADMRGEKND
jgi:rubrerythrin